MRISGVGIGAWIVTERRPCVNCVPAKLRCDNLALTETSPDANIAALHRPFDSFEPFEAFEGFESFESFDKKGP